MPTSSIGDSQNFCWAIYYARRKPRPCFAHVDGVLGCPRGQPIADSVAYGLVLPQTKGLDGFREDARTQSEFMQLIRGVQAD